MNAGDDRPLDPNISFLLLTEIGENHSLSQRELSRRLGVAVGLVNSYLKNLVAKGYVRIRNFPRNRYAYLLTPQGMAEKSRLAYRHITWFNHLYTVVRRDYLDLFRRLEREGFRELSFCGVDEVTEVAYLSLQETRITLAGVYDGEGGILFLGNEVHALSDIYEESTLIVITSIKRKERLLSLLLSIGVSPDRIIVPTTIRSLQKDEDV
ncbi:MAG: winged helix-turn-helix transcriptional regulator [Desulfuromonadia bacterium]